MKVITFYADPPNSTYYSDHAQKWVDNVKSFGLDYYIEELNGDDGYWKNTRKKPQFILNCMNKFQDTILWVDIDDVIIAKPEPLNCDIAFQLFPNDYHHIRSRNKIAASGLTFNYTQKSLNFLKEWTKRCENYKGKPKGDHDIIFGVIKDIDFKKEYYKNNFIIHGQSNGRND